MKFYQFPHSPYCIPISLILKNATIPHEEVLVPNWDRSLVMRLTDGAYYQVPVIQDGDILVYESSDSSLDVAHYVDGLIEHELFPASISGIQEVLITYIESELEGIGFKTVDPDYIDKIEDIADKTNVIRHKERRFGRGCVEAWRWEKEALLEAFYGKIDAFQGTLENNCFPLYSGQQPHEGKTMASGLD
jgi:glutathione S-transferase